MHLHIRSWLLRLGVVLAILGSTLVVGTAAASATNYYFSSSTGSDSNQCTQTQPCQTLTKASSISLQPGDQEEFLRGDTWTGQLDITHSGTSGGRINFFGYGSGGSRPKITGGGSSSRGSACIYTDADYLTVDNLYVTGCGSSGTYSGVEVNGHDVQVKNMQASNNVSGITVDSTNDTNVEINNNTISTNNVYVSGDVYGVGGATGIEAGGPANIHNNTISGSDVSAGGLYYGSGVLIGYTNSVWVHDNTFSSNHVGVQFWNNEGGNSTAVEYNAIGSSVSGDSGVIGIDKIGPSTSTWISHNSIDVVGTGSQGLVCSLCAGGDTVTSNAVKGGE